MDELLDINNNIKHFFILHIVFGNKLFILCFYLYIYLFVEIHK